MLLYGCPWPSPLLSPSVMLQSASCLWSSYYSRLCCRLYWSKGTLASGSKAWFGPGQSVLGIYCKSVFINKFAQFFLTQLHPSNKYILTSAETCTPTFLGSRRTMRPTNLWTTTIITTLLPGITTTTTTLFRLSARACTQPIRPSCSKVDQWDSSPTTDPYASLSGWENPPGTLKHIPRCIDCYTLVLTLSWGFLKYLFPDCSANRIFVHHVAGGQPGVSNLARWDLTPFIRTCFNL